MNVAIIKILIIPFFISIFLVSVRALSGDYTCKRNDTDGQKSVFCCTHYVAKDGKCISCPEGFTSTNGGNCIPCERPFYGRHCVHECKCTDNETCHHLNGCVQIIITAQSTPVSTPDVSKNKEVFGLDFGNKTIYYVALGCVFVMAILIGMMLKGVKKKYCSKRKSEMSVSTEQEVPKESDRIFGGVSRPYHVYDYIDELQMVDKDGILQSPPGLNEMSKETGHFQKVLQNESTSSEGIHVDGDRKNDNDGYLHPYQPIHTTAVDVHAYKSLNIQQDLSVHKDDYLHPYNSLVTQTADVHAYKTLNIQQNPSVQKEDYLHPYNSLVTQTEKDIHKYTECKTLDNIVIQPLNPYQPLVPVGDQDKHDYLDCEQGNTASNSSVVSTDGNGEQHSTC